ncbi:Z1 domain-containing protein [Nonomuraea polychroma]|uniref:Z1 domain-containing protein n=1 Tax=Nonomuraea polychroma TaxID=46176 RepID=A0A438MGM0_9ACTN|nr:Z1 domain-containing protein [Nonomuraea polychroma]RVX44933.1 Z1 domain-containing protein [Nonomuraea polychroma]
MSTSEQTLTDALRVVRALLPVDRHATDEEVMSAVSKVHPLFPGLDQRALLRRVEELVAIFQEDSTGIADDDDTHTPWLPDAKASRNWEFWERYRDYLENVEGLPPEVVRVLNRSTDEVLGELEDPTSVNGWKRAGLVIGQVQSGKTGNYIGLACKGADAGFKLIIILAGIHNDLRSQTQLRIDQGLLGFDTQFQKRYDEDATRYIGAGAMSHTKRLGIGSLTDSTEKGDFTRRKAQQLNFPLGHFPVVLVIKKHRSIIENVRKWLVDVHGTKDEATGKDVIRELPLLLIDDEADHAGIDVSKDAETDPSKVNGEIRKLVHSFEKAGYVGYTATPYANIMIDPDTDHPEFGKDLFPGSFIRVLQPPSNYFGPERVFGLTSDDPEEDGIEALPVTRSIKDSQTWMPSKHKSSWRVLDQLPPSLREAVNAFLLACAARRARGMETVHNSMLVHVTRFTAVQHQVRDLIDDHVRLLGDSMKDRYSVVAAQRLTELRDLWDRDFMSTTKAFPTDQVQDVSWTEVAEHLLPAAQKIQVRAVNGAAKDALEYYESRKTGLSVIAVGGEKLSRGLTLEGLSVSYYLRTAQAYDTLLQMGRWFGYRPGYEDLCRLYTTEALKKAYIEITQATDELRREVEEMSALRAKPSEFGLKVKSSSLGLTITNRPKMGGGTPVRLSYSGDHPETVMFDLKKGAPEKNLANLVSFVRRLDDVCVPVMDGGSIVWRSISAEDVALFLDGYQPDKYAHRVRPGYISKYIRRCDQVGELGNWTVRLVGRADAEHVAQIGGYNIGLISRSPYPGTDPLNEGRLRIRRLISPADEHRDLTKTQKDRALENHKRWAAGKLDKKGNPMKVPTIPLDGFVREVRTTDQGLLLIYPIASEYKDAQVPLVGYAFSFPKSLKHRKTEYVVNPTWLKEQSLLDDEEAEEEAEG